MSFPSRRQGDAFLLPLRGKLTTFVVRNRQDDIHLMRFILSCLYVCSLEPKVLDIDALCSTNAIFISQGINPSFLRKVRLFMPNGLDDFQGWLIGAVTKEFRKPSILDSLNAVHHLLAYHNRKSAMQRLVTLTALISKLARENNALFMTTVYSGKISCRRKGPTEERALPMLGDLVVKVTRDSTGFAFQCEKGEAWKDGYFSVAI